jgi:hypothetical protein
VDSREIRRRAARVLVIQALYPPKPRPNPTCAYRIPVPAHRYLCETSQPSSFLVLFGHTTSKDGAGAGNTE